MTQKLRNEGLWNELPRRKQRGIRCHAGHDPASSLNSWIPAFAGMTTRGKPRGIKPKEIKEGLNLQPKGGNTKKPGKQLVSRVLDRTDKIDSISP
jgi:hypothetical protein